MGKSGKSLEMNGLDDDSDSVPRDQSSQQVFDLKITDFNDSQESGNTTPFSSRGSPQLKDETNIQAVEVDEVVEEEMTRKDVIERVNTAIKCDHKASQTSGIWTCNEMVALFKKLKSNRKFKYSEFPLKKQSDIQKKVNEIRKIIVRIREISDNGMDVYGHWSTEETGCLYWLLSLDLTASTLKQYIPNKSSDQVRGKLLQIRGNTFWTEGEINYVKQQANNEKITSSDLMVELPVRSETTVRDKLKIYRKALNKVEVVTHAKVKRFLRFFDDLTAKSIAKEFPKVTIGKVIQVILEVKPEVRNSSLTSGEQKLIEELSDKDVQDDFLLESFPCRTIDTLRNEIDKINDIKKNNTKDDDILDNKELEIRRNHFKGQVDELVYYAKWFASEKFGQRSSRRSKNVTIELEKLEREAENICVHKKVKKVLTAEELEERRQKKETFLKIQQEKLELRRKKRLEDAERRKNAGPTYVKRLRLVEKLQQEAEYFQSVTGNHKPVEEGERRKRKQTQVYVPEQLVSRKINDRQRRKEIHKEALKKEKERKKMIRKKEREERQRKKRKVIVKVEEESEEESEEEEIIEEKESSVEEEEYVSPYDPYDINTDTLIPLNGRQLYVDEVKNYSMYLPELTSGSDDGFPSIDDELAAEVVISHYKSYNDLPISFPPLNMISSSGISEINPLNRIRLRYLLYPEYSELFILATPKSNELDPIVEMQRLFQIHFALYFSHSEKLKNIIVNDYCRALDECVENNDFTGFMIVVDKWNKLMLKLTPNVKYWENDHHPEDINHEIRAYLQYDNLQEPTEEELKLDDFFEEMKIAEVEEKSPICEKIQNTTENGTINSRTADYITNFFRNLNSKTSISRFCLQQILLQIYSRVVSPDSHKLRSYKAFTAEVYGELLPSFTSEVLTKVDLKPNQKFYDLGSGVGNTTFQAALEFGAKISGGCELMEHASKLTELQEVVLLRKLSVLGLKQLPLTWALLQSFVDNPAVSDVIIDCDVIIVNNYLFDANLNADVGRLLYGVKPGTKIISLRNFIRPRYKVESTTNKTNKNGTIFDYLKVEKFEMSDFLSVSWTANKVPYYISTVQEEVCPEYL